MEKHSAWLNKGIRAAHGLNASCMITGVKGVSISIWNSHFRGGVSYINFHSSDLFILWFSFLTLLSPSSFPTGRLFGLLPASLNLCNSNMIFFQRTVCHASRVSSGKGLGYTELYQDSKYDGLKRSICPEALKMSSHLLPDSKSSFLWSWLVHQCPYLMYALLQAESEGREVHLSAPQPPPPSSFCLPWGASPSSGYGVP